LAKPLPRTIFVRRFTTGIITIVIIVTAIITIAIIVTAGGATVITIAAGGEASGQTRRAVKSSYRYG
jgi:hypothetical protein